MIIPNAQRRNIQTQLDGYEKPEILTYSLESTIAEKLDAILQRFELTGRMKDFYDIYYLSRTFDFDGSKLQTAIQETLQNRGTAYEKDSFDRVLMLADDPDMQIKWRYFLKTLGNPDMPFQEVMVGLKCFLEPIWNAIINEDGAVIEPHSSHTVTFWNYDARNINPETFELSVSYKMDVPFFLTMMVALFVAAIAMIIPGVSGSFVMLTLGVYTTVIGAVKDLDFAIIIPCAIGAVIGLVFGARLITWLMKKYSLMTYSAILGLVAGSIYVIFPAGFGLNLATLAGVICLGVGAFVAYIVGKNTKVGE